MKITGGRTGFWLRRSIHLIASLIPIAYYFYAKSLTPFFGMSSEQIISILVFVVLILEVIRLRYNLTILGQRDYESSRISAFAWSAFSLGVILLGTPKIGLQGAALGVPLIWSWSFGDPLLGDLRRRTKSMAVSFLIGGMVITILWLVCVYWLRTPLWLIPILVPIIVVAEWPNLDWIDDSVTMLLLPLGLLFLLMPWV